MALTIGQLAKLTRLTVRALHHYDAIGLLTASQRSESGYRLYSQRDVARLFRIQALQSVGLSLAEIADVLARDGAPLRDLIAQQLASLDEQLEQTQALRDRLAQLHGVLHDGGEPGIDDWASAVELITQYGKYCSGDDIRRLIEHRNDDTGAWRALVDDWRRAMDEQVTIDSDAARMLLTRWSDLFMRRVGGDLGLAAKLKRAYAEDDALQDSLRQQSGITPQMLAYLGDVMVHAHRAAWARHLSDVELGRLDLHGEWQSKVVPAVSALSSASSDAAKSAAAIDQWRSLLDAVTRGDRSMSDKLHAVLLSDDELARLWLISDAVKDVLKAVRPRSRLQ